MATSNAFSDQDASHRGKYSQTVVDTLIMAYRPFRGRIILSLFLGMLGRIVLLANANVIGHWVDNLGSPHVGSWTSEEYLWLLGAMTLFGFLMTLVFRIGFPPEV